MTLNVSSEHFDTVWARVSPWLQAALDEMECVDTLDTVKAAIMDGRCHLLHCDTGAGVVLVDRFERVKTLRIWLAGGKMDAMELLLPTAEALAASLGCERIAFQGRTGWQRSFLQREGFVPVAVDMKKEIASAVEAASPIEVAHE